MTETRGRKEAGRKFPQGASSGPRNSNRSQSWDPRSKPENRKPKIFVPGPAPDDPGPRLPDGDEPGTPLSRFRLPHNPSRMSIFSTLRSLAPRVTT